MWGAHAVRAVVVVGRAGNAGAARRPHIHDQTPSPMWGAHAGRAVVVVGRAGTAGAARRPHIHDETPSPMWGAHAVRAVVVVEGTKSRRRGAPVPPPRPDPESDVGRARRARGRCRRRDEKPPARRGRATSTTRPRVRCGARTPCARSLEWDGQEAAGAARRPHIHDETPSPMWGAHAVRAVVVVDGTKSRRRGAPALHPRRAPESNVGRARRARGRCRRRDEKPPARRAGPASTTRPRFQCGARTPCARSLSSKGRKAAGAARRPHIEDVRALRFRMSLPVLRSDACRADHGHTARAEELCPASVARPPSISGRLPARIPGSGTICHRGETIWTAFGRSWVLFAGVGPVGAAGTRFA